ncbi:hypothetical protein ACTXT7_008377 [Hymenolepis weldensis]
MIGKECTERLIVHYEPKDDLPIDRHSFQEEESKYAVKLKKHLNTSNSMIVQKEGKRNLEKKTPFDDDLYVTCDG